MVGVFYLSRYLLMMKTLIKRILKEQLEGQWDNPLSEKEIRLF